MAYSAASFAAGGGDHATVRLRPAALAWYRALSAACSKASNPGMPTLAAARPATTPGAPPPVFQQNPQFQQPLQQADDDDDERPAPNVPVPGTVRGPVFNSFPQPQVVTPQGAPMPQPVAGAPQQTPVNGTPASSPTPVAPYGGVSVPGMVAPPPPVPPGQQPVRRPGGPGGK